MLSRCGSVGAARSTRVAVTSAAAASSLLVQRRYLEYWGSGVTGRTQPYAQGDMLPRTDNTRFPVDKPSSAAAALTGNQNGIAYDTTSMFSVEGMSAAEKAHYQPFRGLDRYVIDELSPREGPAAAKLMRELMAPEVEASLYYLWWERLLKDFPSLKKPATAAFRRDWENFFLSTLEVAHDEEAVKVIARPFLKTQMQENFISHAMVWRIAESLGAALVGAPNVTRYEKRTSRMASERVTKIMLNTLADEPWANSDATNPLYVDVSNFRAWHEAGFW